MSSAPLHPNLTALQFVARALGPLRERVVFVGGATVNLLIADPGAPVVRVTDDVDCVVEVATLAAYRKVEAALRKLKIDPDPDGPICRFLVAGAKLDVMPTDARILGFANRWAKEAIERSQVMQLDDLSVKVITAPYFVGTKLEAFRNRGEQDFLASHDLEDLVAVVDGRESLPAEIRVGASDALKQYLVDELGALLRNDAFLEALPAHLPADPASQRRLPVLLDRLHAIVRAGSSDAP